MGFKDFYHMSLSDYTRVILAWTLEAGSKAGWVKVSELLTIGRMLGLSKDPPLVAAHALDPPNGGVEAIWGYVTGRRPPPTEMIEVVDAITSGRLSVVDAVERAIDVGASWEVVRSRVGLEGLPPDLLREAAARLMSKWDVAMQAEGLAERLGEDAAIEVVRLKASGGLPASAAAKAALDLVTKYPKLASQLARAARATARALWATLAGTGLAWKSGNVHYLVDVSCSMEGGPIDATARILIALGVPESYVFNE